jgi:hypothetical protein
VVAQGSGTVTILDFGMSQDHKCKGARCDELIEVNTELNIGDLGTKGWTDRQSLFAALILIIALVVYKLV